MVQNAYEVSALCLQSLLRLSSFHRRQGGSERCCQSWMLFYHDVCHVYSSVAKFIEERVCTRFFPHSLMTEQN